MGSGVLNTGVAAAAALPHALDALDSVSAEIERAGKQVVFFLDFDGTLAPIVPNPDSARMPKETESVLTSLAKDYPTTIVTGRALAKVKSFVQVEEVMFAGSHGFVMEAPAFGVVTMGTEHEEKLAHIKVVLDSPVKQTPGASMEDNRLSISVHYRHVKDEHARAELEATVQKEAAAANLKLHHGKMVWEVRPVFDWHKGKAVDYFMRRLGMNDRERFVPVYIGDDVTDEDAFGVLQSYGGLGVIVWDSKQGPQERPRETKAAMRLNDPKEVCEFLRHFATHKGLRKCGGAASLGLAANDGEGGVGPNAAS